MGLRDLLNRLFPPGKPPFTVEPKCLRHYAFTVKLPLGWQFADNDGRNFRATGPGGASAVFLATSLNQPLGRYAPEQAREMLGKLVRDYMLRKKAVEEAVLPNGVLWFETDERIVLFNLQPRDPQIARAPGLDVTWTGNAEARETLRTTLRGVEWN